LKEPTNRSHPIGTSDSNTHQQRQYAMRPKRRMYTPKTDTQENHIYQKEAYKYDRQKRPIDSLDAHGTVLMKYPCIRQNRHTNETCIHQKETYARDQNKEPSEFRDQLTLKTFSWHSYNAVPIYTLKETYKRDPYTSKRDPYTSKRDIRTRPKQRTL